MLKIYNRYFRNKFSNRYYSETLMDYSKSNKPSRKAIGDHICTLYYEFISQKPTLAVELGTRGGESTRALLAAAQQTNAFLLSIDIDPCGDLGIEDTKLKKWEFIQCDDIKFGLDDFPKWCEKKMFNPEIDFLFIDTSHEYEHTLSELNTWMKYIANRGIVIFHDTNMHNIHRKLDNTLEYGWDNKRGVIQAIEEYLGIKYDENKNFVDIRNGWLVRHFPFSSGLTIMRKL